MAITKPPVSGLPPQKFINKDKQTEMMLDNGLEYLCSASFTLQPNEVYFSEALNVTDDLVLFLWEGTTLLASGKNKIKFENDSVAKTVQLITKKFDEIEENGSRLNPGTYTIWRSPVSFSDGSTDISEESELIVEYSFNKSGTYFIRQNPTLKKDFSQPSIPPLYSLDGVNFITLVPDVNGEFEISIASSEKLIIKSNKDSLWRVSGEQNLDQGSNSSILYFSSTTSSMSSSSTTSYSTTTTTSTTSTSTTTTTPGGEQVTKPTTTTIQNTNQNTIGYRYTNRNRDGVSAINVLKWGTTKNIFGHFAFYGDMTSFTIDAEAGVPLIEKYDYAWANCGSLTTFQTFDVSLGTSFIGTWKNCASCPTNDGIISIPSGAVTTGICG